MWDLQQTPRRGICSKETRMLLLKHIPDYAGSVVDMSYTNGYCTFLGGNLVTPKSKNKVW